MGENTLVVLSVPTDKNLRIEVRRSWGLQLENCLRTYTDMNLFLVFMWGSNEFPKSISDTPSI